MGSEVRHWFLRSLSPKLPPAAEQALTKELQSEFEKRGVDEIAPHDFAHIFRATVNAAARLTSRSSRGWRVKESESENGVVENDDDDDIDASRQPRRDGREEPSRAA